MGKEEKNNMKSSVLKRQHALPLTDTAIRQVTGRPSALLHSFILRFIIPLSLSSSACLGWLIPCSYDTWDWIDQMSLWLGWEKASYWDTRRSAEMLENDVEKAEKDEYETRRRCGIIVLQPTVFWVSKFILDLWNSCGQNSLISMSGLHLFWNFWIFWLFYDTEEI